MTHKGRLTESHRDARKDAHKVTREPNIHTHKDKGAFSATHTYIITETHTDTSKASLEAETEKKVMSMD